MIFIVNFTEDTNSLEAHYHLYYNERLNNALHRNFPTNNEYFDYCRRHFPKCRVDEGSYFHLESNPSKCLNFDIFYDHDSDTGSLTRNFSSHEELVSYRNGFEDWFDSVFIGRIIPAFREICPESDEEKTFSASSYVMTPKLDIKKVDEWMPKLEELKGSEVIIGDKVFRLNPVANLEGTSIIERTKNRYKKLTKKHSEELVSTLKVIEGETDRQIQGWELKMKNVLKMPDIELADYFRNGIGVVKSLDFLTYILPFKYQAKIIDFKYKLSDKHLKECGKKVLIAIDVKEDKVIGTKLLKPNGERFEHYHTMSGKDCLGDYKLPEKIDKPTLLKIRDDIERLFQNINTGSPGRSIPGDGLPTLSELQNKKVLLKKEETKENGWMV